MKVEKTETKTRLWYDEGLSPIYFMVDNRTHDVLLFNPTVVEGEPMFIKIYDKEAINTVLVDSGIKKPRVPKMKMLRAPRIRGRAN